MTRWQQNPSSVTVGLAITAGLFILLATAIAAQAQTFQVLHNFTGGRDGANPLDGVTIDRNGNLYGTASAGGNQVYGCDNFYGTTGCGSVFELERSGSGWILRPLYDFDGGNDFGNPSIGVVLGPDGALYGLSKGPQTAPATTCAAPSSGSHRLQHFARASPAIGRRRCFISSPVSRMDRIPPAGSSSIPPETYTA